MEEDTLRAGYDFSKLGKPIRGKYAKRFQEGTNLILLDKDVAQAFPDERSVNEALRLLMTLAKNQIAHKHQLDNLLFQSFLFKDFLNLYSKSNTMLVLQMLKLGVLTFPHRDNKVV